MSDNRCVCCGEVIPEGVQVCPICKDAAMLDVFKEVRENADTGSNQNVHRAGHDKPS